MKMFLLTVLTVLFVPVALSAEEWARYEQEVTIEYQSADEAQKAKLSATNLPPDKSIAVSSRWDDTTKEHFFMAKTLASNGWKGTFFLNRLDDDFIKRIVPEIVRTGSSVGAHTIRHPHLETVPVNTMFYDILANRVDIESLTNLCVTTFTFPYGHRGGPDSPSTASEQAQALVRTGLHCGPEWAGLGKKLGLTPEQYFVPYMFAANDSDPNAEQFDRGFQNGLRQIQNKSVSVGPAVVLGVHAWQRRIHKDGFDRLGRLLATQANNEKYWYCNMNEYTAWQLAALNNTIVRKSVQDKKVVFKISRIQPFELGALLDMGLKSNPVPVAVVLNSKEIKINKNGEFLLPNSKKYDLPKKIDRIDNLKNKSADSVDLKSKEFPGIRFGVQLDLAQNVLHCCIANESKIDLTGLNLKARLPLLWKKGVLNLEFDKIAAGTTKSFDFKLGEKESAKKYTQNGLYCVVQCDFRNDQENGRIFSTTSEQSK